MNRFHSSSSATERKAEGQSKGRPTPDRGFGPGRGESTERPQREASWTPGRGSGTPPAMAQDHGTGHIIQSLIANSAIAAAKGVAAAFTGSGSLLAETIHSAADCGNQLLLLLGVKRALKPATAAHPLGHGPSLYFWSFMVALMLFTGGGLFSIYEGVHKLHEPEPVTTVWLGFLILGFSLVVEGLATGSNIKEINRRRGGKGFLAYLRDSKDSDLIVVFGENSAAVLGLALALIALFLAWATGDARWDAAGSLAIGAVLIAVAAFLAVEVKSLLVGERADAEVEASIHAEARRDPRILDVHELITVQRGPGQVMASFKIGVRKDLLAPEVCTLIDELEARLVAARPELQWLFVEPDLGPAAVPVAGAAGPRER